MPDFSLAILYVEDPTASARFYADLLDAKPLQGSPDFAMFNLPSGVGIGLRAHSNVEPAVEKPGVGSELAFAVDDVEAAHADWKKRGLVIAQPPTQAPFGLSFVALDPDGHRLRVFSPATRVAPPKT